MTVFDYVVLGVIGVSVLISVIRGFVREVLSLAGWAGAFVAATWLSPAASEKLTAAIEEPALRMVVAFVAVFVVTLIACSLIAMLISRFVRKAGLALEDRVLGGCFGLARGILIVLILVLVGGLTGLPRQPMWNNAMLSPPLEAMAVAVKPWLPRQLSEYVRYE